MPAFQDFVFNYEHNLPTFYLENSPTHLLIYHFLTKKTLFTAVLFLYLLFNNLIKKMYLQIKCISIGNITFFNP